MTNRNPQDLLLAYLEAERELLAVCSSTPAYGAPEIDAARRKAYAAWEAWERVATGSRNAHYHAVMLDETGHGEFGVEVYAESRDAARLWLLEEYPESRCIQLESDEERDERVERIWKEAERSMYDMEDDYSDLDDEDNL
jgi:hypothetical protein